MIAEHEIEDISELYPTSSSTSGGANGGNSLEIQDTLLLGIAVTIFAETKMVNSPMRLPNLWYG